MKGVYNKKNSCLPTLIACLLAAVLVGLVFNAYLTFRLTSEIAYTRNVALEHIHGSLLGRLLLGNDDGSQGSVWHNVWTAIVANNNTIPLLLAHDLYFNFQQTAKGVAEMARRVSKTVADAHALIPEQLLGVVFEVSYYANMVESIAHRVSQIPPMKRTATTTATVDDSQDASVSNDQEEDNNHLNSAAVADDDFNLMQTLTDVIAELPPWFDKQLNVSDWRQLGKACNQLMVNVLKVNWFDRFDCYWVDTTQECFWEIPYEIQQDVFQTAQAVCWTVSNWQINADDATSAGNNGPDQQQQGQIGAGVDVAFNTVGAEQQQQQ